MKIEFYKTAGGNYRNRFFINNTCVPSCPFPLKSCNSCFLNKFDSTEIYRLKVISSFKIEIGKVLFLAEEENFCENNIL